MDYTWLIEAFKWSTLIGLFIFAAWACYYYKSQYEERLAIVNIKENKGIISDYLLGKKIIDICPRCNNKSFNIVGISKIDNFLVAQRKPLIIPLLVLGCNSCGYIETMNYSIVDNNLNDST